MSETIIASIIGASGAIIAAIIGATGSIVAAKFEGTRDGQHRVSRRAPFLSIIVFSAIIGLCIGFFTKYIVPPEIFQDIAQQIGLDGGEVVFEDDFSANVNNWGKTATSKAVLDIHDGYYQFEFSLNGGWWNTYLPIQIAPVKDFQIESNIKKVSGVNNYGYGIEWGRKDDRNLYYFVISGDGKYCYGKRMNGTWNDLIKWSQSAYVKKSNSTNKLTIKREGELVKFFVNNHYVNEAEFEDFFGDFVGFIMTGGPIKIEIDSIVIKQW